MDDPKALNTKATGWIRGMTDGESGGSQPHVFSTDDGDFLVKASNNPQGQRVLANELVAGLSMDWLGVEHPRSAVVDVPQDVLDGSPDAHFNDGTQLAAGESFGSELRQSDPGGTVDVSLIENTGDVAGTVALDTWIQPHDGRQYRVRASPETPGRYEFIPVDQGFSFGNPGWDDASLSNAPAPTVPAAPVPVAGDDVQPFIERLRSFTKEDAEKIVSQVPSTWLGDDERESLVDYLARRAPEAADALEAAYPAQEGGSAA